VRYVKPKLIAALLAFAIGFGVDIYIRSEAARDRGCFGCITWQCEVVGYADHPLIALRMLWERLTD
jgi:hypothetical protein